MKLRHYDYKKISLNLALAIPNHPDLIKPIEDFIYCLENHWRMHWIDDLLYERYSETVDSLLAKLNIELSYVD